MEEFILYVSPNWSPWQFPVSLIHTWQQINVSTLFRCSLSLPLGIEIQKTANVRCFACVTVRELSLSVYMQRVSGSEREERERKKGTRARRSLVHRGVTSCLSKLEHLTPDRWLISRGTPAAKSDYYPTASALGFPLPVCFYWNVSERLRMRRAAAGDRGTHCLGLIVLPLCNQEG